jgi:hypothetical protein
VMTMTYNNIYLSQHSDSRGHNISYVCIENVCTNNVFYNDNITISTDLAFAIFRSQ